MSNFHDGIWINGDGYRMAWNKNLQKYEREHKIIYEQHHKCQMLKWGVVHHLNHIKTDNRIENLQGMMKANHHSLHCKGMTAWNKGLKTYRTVGTYTKGHPGYWKGKKRPEMRRQNYVR